MSRPFAAVESFFERVLERPAARLFRAHPQPVQLERRIERAMGAMRLVASGQTYVPSRYRILLHPADLEALQASDEDLPSLLADAILVRAREQGRWLLRQPDVSLVASPRIAQGDLEVDAEPLDPSLVAAAATGLRPVELGGPRPPRAPIPGTGVIDDEDVVQPPGALAAPGPSAPPKPRDTARAAIPVVAEADTPPPVLPIVPAPPHLQRNPIIWFHYTECYSRKSHYLSTAVKSSLKRASRPAPPRSHPRRAAPPIRAAARDAPSERGTFRSASG